MNKNIQREPLTTAEFEAIRDSFVIVARRMNEPQILELTDYLHAALRNREPKSWEEAAEGTAGFA